MKRIVVPILVVVDTPRRLGDRQVEALRMRLAEAVRGAARGTELLGVMEQRGPAGEGDGRARGPDGRSGHERGGGAA